MPVIIEKDALIIGGGIAGLWMLNRLRAASYDVMLLEQNQLGAGQSIASQGMIHGGIKYALGASLNSASAAIADMPDHWKNCLEGRGDIDLSGTNILSDCYYMWPRSSLRSRFNAFLGSKALRGKVTSVEKLNYPAFFKDRINGPLYQLKDIVLDVPSLLTRLSDLHHNEIKCINWNQCEVEMNSQGEISSLSLQYNNETYIIKAKRFLISSGEGSADLLKKLIPQEEIPEKLQMQIRPLQMTLVKHQHPHPIYVHCVAEQLTATPEVTITTHNCRDGDVAWYLGGELAESGAHRSPEAQIQAAQLKLSELFPWCDLSKAQWHSFFINRAEASTKDGKRPENASIHQYKNIVRCWPSKLTLAPVLGQQILELFQTQNLVPASHNNPGLSMLPFPGIAVTPWDAMS